MIYRPHRCFGVGCDKPFCRARYMTAILAVDRAQDLKTARARLRRARADRTVAALVCGVATSAMTYLHFIASVTNIGPVAFMALCAAAVACWSGSYAVTRHQDARDELVHLRHLEDGK